jgi:hypothetical protein
MLERIRRVIESEEFGVQDHGGLKTELSMRTTRAATLLGFLINDPTLFEQIRAITGCERIGTFVGRIYRMLPGPEHEDSWHDDVTEGRMVAMSLNLGEAPYSGGVLEIRDRDSKRVLHRVENTGPGDALLFRIARGLQHRVTAVEGSVPKTAYAGWFTSNRDFELLRPGDFLRDAAPS